MMMQDKISHLKDQVTITSTYIRLVSKRFEKDKDTIKLVHSVVKIIVKIAYIIAVISAVSEIVLMLNKSKTLLLNQYNPR